MAKFSKKTQDKVRNNMEEMKEGKLRSGSGKKVTSRKQAIAIRLSEARKSGSKVPSKKSGAAPVGRRRKPGSENAASKKSAPKKSTAKKRGRPALNSTVKKSPAKKRGRPAAPAPQKRILKTGTKSAAKKSGAKKRGRPSGTSAPKKSAPQKSGNKRGRRAGS